MDGTELTFTCGPCQKQTTFRAGIPTAWRCPFCGSSTGTIENRVVLKDPMPAMIGKMACKKGRGK